MRSCVLVVCCVLGLGGVVSATGGLADENWIVFLRGDSNGDGAVDGSDSSYTANFMFQGGPAPVCMDAADANDDGVIDNADTSYVMNWYYGGGSAPPPPGPVSCGTDDTADYLDCEYHPCME